MGVKVWSLTLREERRMVHENRAVRRISGTKRDEVAGEWRKLHIHNEELNDLYFLSNIVQVIKSRRLRLAGHVARKRGEVYTGFCWGNLRERDHLEDPGVDGMVILRWISRKWDVAACAGLIWLRTTGGGHL